MICPDCKSKFLKILQSLELPPDSTNDEITLQTVCCDACGFQSLAVYKESRRGRLDSESWVHEGYRVSDENFKMINKLIRGCPHPTDKRCQCSTHLSLGCQTEFYWDGLSKIGVEIKDIFNL